MSRWVIGGGGAEHHVQGQIPCISSPGPGRGRDGSEGPPFPPVLAPPLARSLMASPRHFPSRFSLPLL